MHLPSLARKVVSSLNLPSGGTAREVSYVGLCALPEQRGERSGIRRLHLQVANSEIQALDPERQPAGFFHQLDLIQPLRRQQLLHEVHGQVGCLRHRAAGDRRSGDAAPLDPFRQLLAEEGVRLENQVGVGEKQKGLALLAQGLETVQNSHVVTPPRFVMQRIVFAAPLLDPL